MENNTSSIEEIDKISRETTLKVIRLVTDETNYKLLNMLPANTSSISHETGLSKSTISKRLKILGEYKLVRFGGFAGSNIVRTTLADNICKLIECIIQNVHVEVAKLLPVENINVTTNP